MLYVPGIWWLVCTRVEPQVASSGCLKQHEKISCRLPRLPDHSQHITMSWPYILAGTSYIVLTVIWPATWKQPYGNPNFIPLHCHAYIRLYILLTNIWIGPGKSLLNARLRWPVTNEWALSTSQCENSGWIQDGCPMLCCSMCADNIYQYYS